MKKTNIITSMAAVALMSSAAFAQTEEFCSNAAHSGKSVTVTSNVVGSIGNIGYELWDENGNGGSVVFYDDGSMDCEISHAKDYLCRAGLSLGSDKTYDQLGGDMVAEFKLVKTPAQNVQYSYIGVYGWMEGVEGTSSKLVEYYVIDNTLASGMPGDWIGNEKKGTIQVDGGTYTVYRNTRTGPAIKNSGSVQFYQYFSVRTQARDCGTINISEHMRQWEKMGLKMGVLYEAKVLGEAGNTSAEVTNGRLDFPHAKVYIDDGSQSATPTSSEAAPASSSDAAPASSSEAAPASSSEAAAVSSSDAAPASSSEAAPASSSEAAPASSSTDAIRANVKLFAEAGSYQVFDMLGKFMGKVELTDGASLSQALFAKFGKAGVYMVKRGGVVSPIVVK